MTTASHFLISGRVQGVSYRANARARALRLGLTGWARNLPDGRVEVQVWGELETIDRYARWLEDGPSGARVRGVERRDVPADNPPAGFHITG